MTPRYVIRKFDRNGNMIGQHPTHFANITIAVSAANELIHDRECSSYVIGRVETWWTASGIR